MNTLQEMACVLLMFFMLTLTSQGEMALVGCFQLLYEPELINVTCRTQTLALRTICAKSCVLT